MSVLDIQGTHSLVAFNFYDLTASRAGSEN